MRKYFDQEELDDIEINDQTVLYVVPAGKNKAGEDLFSIKAVGPEMFKQIRTHSGLGRDPTSNQTTFQRVNSQDLPIDPAEMTVAVLADKTPEDITALNKAYNTIFPAPEHVITTKSFTPAEIKTYLSLDLATVLVEDFRPRPQQNSSYAAIYRMTGTLGDERSLAEYAASHGNSSREAQQTRGRTARNNMNERLLADYSQSYPALLQFLSTCVPDTATRTQLLYKLGRERKLETLSNSLDSLTELVTIHHISIDRLAALPETGLVIVLTGNPTTLHYSSIITALQNPDISMDEDNYQLPSERTLLLDESDYTHLDLRTFYNYAPAPTHTTGPQAFVRYMASRNPPVEDRLAKVQLTRLHEDTCRDILNTLSDQRIDMAALADLEMNDFSTVLTTPNSAAAEVILTRLRAAPEEDSTPTAGPS